MPILILGSCIFELILPFVVGYYINAIALDNTKPKPKDFDFINRETTILIILLAANFVSSLCEFVKTNMLKMRSE